MNMRTTASLPMDRKTSRKKGASASGMTNDAAMAKPECWKSWAFRHSGFVILSSFVIGHLSFFERRHHGFHLDAWQGRWLGNLAIAQGAAHLEHFAPGRERPAVGSLVLVHRLHEFNFVVGVVAFAGGRIDLAAPLAALAAVLASTTLDGHGNLALATVTVRAAVPQTPIARDVIVKWGL